MNLIKSHSKQRTKRGFKMLQVIKGKKHQQKKSEASKSKVRAASPASAASAFAGIHVEEGEIDRVFAASLPVVSGGPAAWFSKARERGAEEEVFRHCALVRVNKGTLNKNNNSTEGKRRASGDTVMAEEEEAEDKDEDDDVPVVVRLRLERLAGSHRLVRVSVRLDLADHFFLHSASVAFHGGAYFSGCGASTFVPEDSGDCGSNSVSSSSSEHHFILETCKPGTPRPIDESVCRKASHDQCNFNDSCMLEVAVRTREERVTVVSEAAAGSRLARRVADLYNGGRDPRGTDVVLRCEGRDLPFYRLVLSAHSPVLGAMLDDGEGAFAEGREGRVEVRDCPAEALAAMLRLLADGKIGRRELRRHALDLYVLCDKYDIGELSSVCEREAAEAAEAAWTSDDDHVLLRYLVAAHLHGSPCIRRAAISALRRRRRDLATGRAPAGVSALRRPESVKGGEDAWEALAAAHPDLAAEVMAAVAEP